MPCETLGDTVESQGDSGGLAQNGVKFCAEMCKIRTTIITFGASRNSEPDPFLSTGSRATSQRRKRSQAGQNRPWVSHAGGQDEGSLHKLPQIIYQNKVLRCHRRQR